MLHITSPAMRHNLSKLSLITVPSCALQSIQMGIALPAWLLDGNSQSAPLLLAGLVGAFILLPLIVATYYLFNANKYSDGIMDDTYQIFIR